MSTISPHADRLAFAPEFDTAAGVDVLDDRRIAERADRPLLVTLFRDDGAKIGPCRTDNVSESGLHVTVPIGFGLAVGQRYEVVIRDADGPRIEEGLYATVVRTQMRAGPAKDSVGVGLRLDQPLFL